MWFSRQFLFLLLPAVSLLAPSQATDLIQALQLAGASQFAAEIQSDPAAAAIFFSNQVQTVFAPIDGSTNSSTSRLKRRQSAAAALQQKLYQSTANTNALGSMSSGSGLAMQSNFKSTTGKRQVFVSNPSTSNKCSNVQKRSFPHHHHHYHYITLTTTLYVTNTATELVTIVSTIHDTESVTVPKTVTVHDTKVLTVADTVTDTVTDTETATVPRTVTVHDTKVETVARTVTDTETATVPTTIRETKSVTRSTTVDSTESTTLLTTIVRTEPTTMVVTETAEGSSITVPATVFTTVSTRVYSTVSTIVATRASTTLLPAVTSSVLEISSGLGKLVSIIQGDIPYNGGLVHAVDNYFTLPEGLIDTANANGQTAFTGLVSSHGLTDTFDNTPDLTYFIPANSALAMPNATRAYSSIQNLLLGHAIPNFVGYLPSLRNGSTYESLGGTSFTVFHDDCDYRVNNAKIILPNVIVGNGVAHVVDQVIEPLSTATAAPSPNSGSLLWEGWIQYTLMTSSLVIFLVLEFSR